MRRARRIRMSLKFLLLVLSSVIRQRAFALKPRAGTLTGVTVTPQGEFLPQMAGGDETPEEKAEREAKEKAQQEQEAAEEEAEAAEEAAKKAEEEAGGKEWEGEVDKKKAERAVRNARRDAREAKERADAAEKRARELEQAQETEHETAKRERDEAKAEVEREREAARRLKVDLALRDAAAEADVPAKKVRRLLKLAERDEIKIDADGNVDMETATEAVADVLEEFPEFKGEPAPEEEEREEEKPGGKPDRRRKPKELTRADVEKMAKEEPDRLNDLMDEGKIPASALG